MNKPRRLRSLLPQEHGAWVLFGVAVTVAAIVNPGPGLVAVAIFFFSVFLGRPATVRIARRRGGVMEARVLASTSLIAISALALGFDSLRPEAFRWIALAFGLGLIVLWIEVTRRLRGMKAELAMTTASVPLLPVLLSSGSEKIDQGVLVTLAVALWLYLLASVFRVRATALQDRKRVGWKLRGLGAGLLPVAAIVGFISGFSSVELALSAVPMSVIGVGMVIHGVKHRVALWTVGALESIGLIAFAWGLIAQASI